MVAAIILRARNTALRFNSQPSVPDRRANLIPFPDSHWQTCARQREAHDSHASVMQWRISINPGDACFREYYMRGTYAAVTARARFIFPSPQSILVEPAVFAGGELIDGRFHVLNSN
jgi:hypothetical protein